MALKNKVQTVGIFSGTFDPIHNGHLQLARDAISRVGLNKIFFLVEPLPRRKQGVKAFEHRLKMVQLAVEIEPIMGTIELHQQRFTPHETMPVLHARFEGAKLYLLMGDDMLKYLGDWPHVDELIGDSHFIIGVRGDEETAKDHIKTIETTRGLRIKHHMFQSTYSAVSSSRVKAALRRSGKSPDVPQAVMDYIESKGLYASASDT